MFHPVGSQSPSTYWRCRLLLFGSGVLILVLLALTVHAVTASGGAPRRDAAAVSTPSTSSHRSSDTPSARSSSSPTSLARTTTSPSSTATGATSAAGRARTSTGQARPSSAGSATGTMDPAPACSAGDLSVSATVAHSTYASGQDPVVGMQVTNVSDHPCVQNLAQNQIVFKVYNGESRVWDSQDCSTEPGTDDSTVMAKQTVHITMAWTGLTSEPGCKGTRQQVGAGTYTLFASLSGRTGRAAQFTIN